MVDGNFSQKRYSNSGNHIHAPFFGNIYLEGISDDKDDNTAPVEGCPNTRSGDVRKKADPRCDITGIFGSVCPHGVPFKFFGKMKLINNIWTYVFRYQKRGETGLFRRNRENIKRKVPECPTQNRVRYLVQIRIKN